jgi:hypothetical protein
MTNEEERSEIGELNEKLNSRTRYYEPTDSRSTMSVAEDASVEEKWQSPDLNDMLQHNRKPMETHPVMKKIFSVSVIFFILAVLVAGYIFLGGANFVSSKNVEISIVGPSNVAAGEVLDLGITIKNKNNADLEVATLSIQYPQGTRNPEDTSKTLTYTKESVDSIRAGREVSRNVKAVIFGSIGEVKEIKISVEYKVKDSNAIFYKDKVYQVTIGNSPLSLVVETPRQANSGESFSTLLTVTLNSEEAMKNVMLKAEYPYGYVVTDTSPNAVFDQNVWSLGDMSPGEKKTVQIRGSILGENDEERTFRFYLGIADASGASSGFRTVITSTQNTVAIARPSLGLSILFGSDNTTSYVAPAGRDISTTVNFQNNLPERILNPRVEVIFYGSALDKSSVSSRDGGFYDSQNNRITWEFVNRSGVNEIGPGDAGRVSFNFASLADLPVSTSGREIKFDVVLTGTPIGAQNQRPISVTQSRVVKISSQTSLSSSVLYSKGPFSNTGPIPPKAEERTTYTVVWNVGNTQTDIVNAQVTAKLGPGVAWVGTPGVSGEDIAYNQSAGTITWDLGKIESGAGFSAPGREVAFQVALTPSLSQVGTAPVLVNSIVLNGSNMHTGQVVTVTNQPLTTRLVGDSTYVQGDDIVVR